jgi:phosphonoacetate hydrolase
MKRANWIPAILVGVAATFSAPSAAPAADEPPLVKTDQRTVIVMLDGFGVDYLEQSSMPVLKGLMAKGFYKTVRGMMPAVTNTNNASIACGVWPSDHGITGNSYFDESTGRAEYMEDASALLAPTLFQKAAKLGIKTALLTAKKKTVNLLSRGTELAIAAEAPSADEIRRYGNAPPIYSREINYWLWQAAIDLLKTRRELRCVYVHTTDYPMHMWPPSAPESKEHLARIDELIGQAVAAAPDAAFLITADHGMNFKKRCWDLDKACRNRGLELRFALSAERDRYVKHHRTYGGTAWVWMKSPGDAQKAKAIITKLEGVDEVLTRAEAATRFHLMPARIGELVVLGDKDTVFGEADSEREELPTTFRTHGSTHETEIPLIIYNAKGTLPSADQIDHNLDLTRTLYRSGD